MAKLRVTATDRLANVIEVVELGQRTGLLAVERGSGSVLEEGAIYFVSGHVIYAALAGLRGREALTALSRWGTCRFSFDREVPQPTPNIAGSSPSNDTAAATGWRSPTPPMGTSQPGYQSPPSSSLSGSWPAQPTYDPSQNGATGSLFPPTSQPNGTSGYTPPQTQPGFGGAQRMPLPTSSTPNLPSNTPYPSMPYPNTPAPSGSPLSGGLLNRRPRRAPDVRDLMSVVTTHNLSRGHRTILLLADGEHTVLDLARLSSKSVDEVTGLLGELETRGLVYYYQ